VYQKPVYVIWKNEINTSEDAKKFLRITRLIHFAMVLGVVLFGGVSLFISAKELSFTPAVDSPIIWAAILCCITTIGLSLAMVPIYLKISATPENIRSAIQQYQTFCILRWAIVEGGALFSGMTIILTKNILPICLFVLLVSLLIYFYPSKKEFIALSEEKL